MSMLEDPFTLPLFSARLLTDAVKFRLPIGKLSMSTNRQSEFFKLRKMEGNFRNLYCLSLVK